MAATRYNVADLRTTLKAIQQNFEKPPENVMWRQFYNLKTELAATLSFLDETTAEAKASKTLKDEPAIIEGFRRWADSVVWEDLDPEDPNAQLTCTMMWYTRTLEHRARWTKSPDGFLLYLSLLPAEQPKAFEWDSASLPVAEWQKGDASLPDEYSLERASYYLSLLNAEFNDRVPDEYYKECLWTEMRDAAVPEYTVAAQKWHANANRYWSALRPQIFTLFNSSNKNNFVQWALEWARKAEPGLFKTRTRTPRSACAEATIDLTTDLCTGRLSPLHIAAILGLPNLCRDLISAGMDPHCLWKGRLPLHSALEGDTSCFWEYMRSTECIPPEVRDGTWPFRFGYKHYSPGARAETISVLLEASSAAQLDELSGSALQLAPIALWASYKIGDPKIFERTLDCGAAITVDFCKMLIEDALSPSKPQDAEMLSKLLTYLHGKCLLRQTRDDDLRPALTYHVADAMNYHGVDFHLVDGSCSLSEATPTKLALLAQESIFAGSAHDLSRICLEPRFNPNPIPGDVAHGAETLLHLAVEVDNLEMVDALMKAGADIAAVDESNRTPLMNSESPRMIERLVLQYGASTESQDNEGRTIWHSAAYNNDLSVLSALSKIDPRKDNNLIRRSDEGCTPLAEAMLLIERVKDISFTGGPLQKPVAARYLLKRAKEHGSDQCLASPVPLTHLAAAWGELDMVEDLAACKADWYQFDDEGRTALHYLNFSASEELVEEVQLLCYGVDMNRSDHNVLETIFLNSAPRGPDYHFSIRQPSHHPSCHQRLLRETFSALLTPEREFRPTPKGLHLWESFCRTIFPIPYKGPMLDKMAASVRVALQYLIDQDILLEYEVGESKSGAACLLDTKKSWEGRKRNHSSEGASALESDLIRFVLRRSEERLRRRFYKSEEAILLLNIAIIEGNLAVVNELCVGGTQAFVHSPHKAAMASPLVTDLESNKGDLRIFNSLLEVVDKEELTKGALVLLKALCRTPKSSWFIEVSLQTQKLRLLLEKGMDPKSLQGDHRACATLATIMRGGPKQFVEVLNEYGAGLTEPCKVCAADQSVAM